MPGQASADGGTGRMRYVLIGDGDSPHLLKWARALARQPQFELWALSSRGFLPAFDAVIDPARRLALGTTPRAEGGNIGLLRSLPRAALWLRRLRPDWLHAHYLSSHGTLAWLAQLLFRVPGRLVASAWGSDILVAPQRSAWLRRVTTQVLKRAALCTSDSQVMARRMHELGAREVMVFPFGLEAMPPPPPPKVAQLFFANRALEPIYAPERVLHVFADLAWHWPQAQLEVANDGSMRAALERQAQATGIGGRTRFLGRLDADAQAAHYAQAQWYLSLPFSDSVSVSVLEAMAHGCIPILSDLPANRELVRHRENGVLLAEGQRPAVAELAALAQRAEAIAAANRAWVGEHALFAPAVERFVQRLFK